MPIDIERLCFSGSDPPKAASSPRRRSDGRASWGRTRDADVRGSPAVVHVGSTDGRRLPLPTADWRARPRRTIRADPRQSATRAGRCATSLAVRRGHGGCWTVGRAETNAGAVRAPGRRWVSIASFRSMPRTCRSHTRFPASARRTVRADFQHTALGLVSRPTTCDRPARGADAKWKKPSSSKSHSAVKRCVPRHPTLSRRARKPRARWSRN